MKDTDLAPATGPAGPHRLTPARLAALALLAVAGAALLISSRGLPQRNTIELFLDAPAVARVEAFRERFDERPTLVARLRAPADLDLPAARAALDAALADARATARELAVELVTGRDLGPRPTPPLSYAPAGAHPPPAAGGPSLPEVSPPRLPEIALSGPRFEAFIAVLPRGGEERPGAELVDRIAAGAAAHGLEVDLAGVPYTRRELDRASAAIGGELFPIVFALGFALVVALLRDLRAAALLYAPALLATGISLATIRALHGELDMVTAIVPLLVFVLNLCLAFHLRAVVVSLGSFRRGLRDKARPIALMVLTTSIGFGTLALSEIASVRRFGALSAALVVLTAGTTLVWLAIAAPALPPRRGSRAGLRGPLARAALWRPAPAAVLALLAAVATAGVLGISSLPVETDALSWFPESSGIRARARALEREVIGTPVLEVVATPPAGVASLADLDRATRAVESAAGPGARVWSRSALLCEAVRRAGLGDKLPAAPLDAAIWHALPEPLRNAYGHDEVGRVTVLAETRGAAEQRAAVERIDRALAAALPGWSFTHEGMVHELLAAQEGLIRILGRSFLGGFLVIGGLYWLSTKSLRRLGLFLVVNVIPVGGGYAVAALLGYSLHVATVMVASVALGMVVDSTLHIIHALDRGPPGPEGREILLRSTLEPVIASAAVLVPCFLAFGLFGFAPIREFGVTLGATIAIALLSNLYAVPALHALFVVRGKGTAAGGDEPAARNVQEAPDAVVVGGGFSGLSFAAALAERGGRVVVLEGEPRIGRNVCGEYLCPSGVSTLRSAGWEELLDGSAPITGMVLASPAGRVVTGDFPADGAHRDGRAIDRSRLLGRLRERAVRAGAEVRLGARVAELVPLADGWRVRLDGGEGIDAPLLVGADGRRSMVARSLGRTIRTRERRVAIRGYIAPRGGNAPRGEMHILGDGSYVGVNPISTTEANVSICLDRERLRELGGPWAAFAHCAEASPRLRAGFDWSTLRDVRGAYPLRHRVRSPVARRAALIGDAGGFIDPLTGEGMSIALWSGIALARAVAGPLRTGDRRALEREIRRHGRERRRRFRQKAFLSRLLQAVIRRPRLCEAIARALARSPARTSIFLGAIGNHYTPLGALARWLLARDASAGAEEAVACPGSSPWPS